jgi:hypothetical protein
MPLFVYQPEGAEPREWDWAPYKMQSPDAELIEQLSDMLFSEWIDAVTAGSMRARHALLFVLLRKEQPGLKYDELQFSYGETSWRLSDAELIASIMKIRRLPVDEWTANDQLVIASYSERLTQAQLDQIDVDLAAEGADEPADEALPLDPTPPASEPESARAKPGKKGR